jgi:glycosyltransferase involved in cell wall biosynthesis
MRVLHIATQDIGGGAFEAAYRLHCNLKLAGHESVMVVLKKYSADPSVIDFTSRLTGFDRLRRLWGTVISRLLRWRYGPSYYFRIDKGEYFPVKRLIDTFPFKPDAIVFHWTSNFITSGMMAQIGRKTGSPLYWYMMDMAPMTGGCDYAFECLGYTLQCGTCPQIRRGSHKLDISYRQWQKKFNDIVGIDITAVVGSTWARRQAMDSSIFAKQPIKKILLGIDPHIFRPISQAVARAKLHLPDNKKIIFFGAHSINEERKGMAYLISAIAHLYTMFDANPSWRSNILVVTAGSVTDFDQVAIPFEHRHLGLLKGNDMLAAAYQSADVFVSASIEDSGPMMINESILCGTPVVAFDMGVAYDFLEEGKVGYLARLKDASDMASGLHMVLTLEDVSVRRMREECRELGLRLCHPDVQVGSFMELFEMSHA